MTDAAPVQLLSAYTGDDPRPYLVKRWETAARSHQSAEAATTQLIYELLLQVRVIKMILMVVLVIVPIVVVGGAVALIVEGSPAQPDYDF